MNQSHLANRFWVAKPIYKEISIVRPQIDYWTVSGDLGEANTFYPALSKPKTILTRLQLDEKSALTLADLFELERLASIKADRPAYYRYILIRFLKMNGEKDAVISDYDRAIQRQTFPVFDFD